MQMELSIENGTLVVRLFSGDTKVSEATVSLATLGRAIREAEANRGRT